MANLIEPKIIPEIADWSSKQCITILSSNLVIWAAWMKIQYLSYSRKKMMFIFYILLLSQIRTQDFATWIDVVELVCYFGRYIIYIYNNIDIYI